MSPILLPVRLSWSTEHRVGRLWHAIALTDLHDMVVGAAAHSRVFDAFASFSALLCSFAWLPSHVSTLLQAEKSSVSGDNALITFFLL